MSSASGNIVLRDPAVFSQLPIDFRWEFTRRHPYYLAFWQNAREYLTNRSEDEPLRLIQEAASQILTGINISAAEPPPDPATDYDSIGGNCSFLGAAWRGGAVAPAIFKTLATILFLSLPKAERVQLGRIFVESGEYEKTDDPMRQLLVRLATLPGEIWNSYPEAPFVGINLQAPQRATVEAITTLVQEMKRTRGIEEVRRRDDKLDDYLRVWDLREGWHEGAYHPARESRLTAIAAELHVPVSTISNRYKTAFRFLTGHEYRPELWVTLFGATKLSSLISKAGASDQSLSRPWRTRSPRPVSESTLLPNRNSADHRRFMERAGVHSDQLDLVDLQLDIQSLVASGHSDAEICTALDLPAESFVDLIAVLRARSSESL